LFSSKVTIHGVGSNPWGRVTPTVWRHIRGLGSPKRWVHWTPILQRPNWKFGELVVITSGCVFCQSTLTFCRLIWTHTWGSLQLGLKGLSVGSLSTFTITRPVSRYNTKNKGTEDFAHIVKSLAKTR